MSDWMKSIRKGTDRPVAEDVLILGPHGTGKSTFGRGAPDPIVICTDSHEAADVPADVPNITPTCWDDPDGEPYDPSNPSLLGFLRNLSKEEHPYKSVVIDTLTSAQTLCAAHVCAKHDVAIVGDIPWNKGSEHLANAWRPLIALLEEIHKKGIHTIRIAHVEVKRHKNPEGADWDQFVAQLDPGLAKLSAQSASNVLFALPELHAVKIGAKKENNEKTVGAGNGKFVLRTTYSATVAAKERLFLPDQLDVSWAAFQIAAQEGRAIRNKLDKALRSMGLKNQAAAEKYLSDARYSREAAITIITNFEKAKNGSTSSTTAKTDTNSTKENTAS